MNTIRPRLSPEEWEVIKKLREQDIQEPSLASQTELDDFLSNHNINHNSVESVKFWQTQSGETRFSIVSKNKKELNVENLFKELVEDLKSYAPKFSRRAMGPSVGENCFVFAPSDIHIGKYASEDEVGSDWYNIDRAVERTRKATHKMIEMASGFPLNKVIFVVGNDILHVDNGKSTTTSGTPQDTDGMWHECFVAAERLYVDIIESLSSLADVHVVFVPSNHDYVSGFMLARVLKAFFDGCEGITFDVQPSHRKYISYGTSLMGFSHGDGAKESDLPIMMAQEASEEWHKHQNRYWYLGHIHHKKNVKYQVSKDYPAVTVEYLRSPSGADSWHHRKGYQHAPKAIEGFIHHETNGQVARLTYAF